MAGSRYVRRCHKHISSMAHVVCPTVRRFAPSHGQVIHWQIQPLFCACQTPLLFFRFSSYIYGEHWVERVGLAFYLPSFLHTLWLCIKTSEAHGHHFARTFYLQVILPPKLNSISHLLPEIHSVALGLLRLTRGNRLVHSISGSKHGQGRSFPHSRNGLALGLTPLKIVWTCWLAFLIPLAARIYRNVYKPGTNLAPIDKNLDLVNSISQPLPKSFLAEEVDSNVPRSSLITAECLPR